MKKTKLFTSKELIKINTMLMSKMNKEFNDWYAHTHYIIYNI